jgi:small GTP-binding protein
MRKLTVGVLAHVDAGKTTLSESMLYYSGKIRTLGRVDNKDAYLDTFELERARGITIFSKQAVMNFDDTEITLLDTPGHVDFSAEMERTLQVLDYAILVVSGMDGVQNHTKTVWELLDNYNVPTFIFVNKMDQKGTEVNRVMESLHKDLSDRCIYFNDEDIDERNELLALCDEDVMDNFMTLGDVSDEDIRDLIIDRKAFPVFFGSALKQDGTDEFFNQFLYYTEERAYPEEFGAKVFKITRDSQGNRLTHMKITAGSLKVKDPIESNEMIEKVNQIRVYSGEKYHTESSVEAGTICAVTGLTKTRPGEGLGIEVKSNSPYLEPVLSYKLVLEDGIDERQVLPYLRELEDEEPELRVLWEEENQSIFIQVMGKVQLEILSSILENRFGINVSFGHGEIVYRETIKDTVEGVGHFEPLRHYSEVHLLMEAGPKGSGMVFSSKCSEDILSRNWQNLVLQHLNEKAHRGVLIGANITDMKITLVSGKAHNKHTSGGDFRQATYRAVRQGLMEASSVILEPYYRFKLNIPENMLGKAMTDIDQIHGTCVIEKIEGDSATLVGEAPVATMRNYQEEVYAYTKGEGRLSISVKGYDICHNSEEIIEKFNYDPELDLFNPSASVFCSKGTGYTVSWDEVKKHMHVESYLKPSKGNDEKVIVRKKKPSEDDYISHEEIDAIFNKTFYANQGRKSIWKKRKTSKESYYASTSIKSNNRSNSYDKSKEEYLLVDGYNIIHDWEELKELTKDNMDIARAKLMDILSNYQSLRGSQILLVFDAYRVKGGRESVEDYHNIRVVYTAEAQTADQYIERFARENKSKYRITVATSDGLQQIIIRGANAGLMSARELRDSVIRAEENLSSEHLESTEANKNLLEDIISDEIKKKLNE